MLLKLKIEQDIELAKMMAEDIDKVYRKYSKSALRAEKERKEKIRNEKYHGCADTDELQTLYAYDEITIEEYDAGRDFFKEQVIRERQLSIVEKHRINLRELRDRWKGTINELRQEIDELNGVEKDNRTFLEKVEHEERAERYASMK